MPAVQSLAWCLCKVMRSSWSIEGGVVSIGHNGEVSDSADLREFSGHVVAYDPPGAGEEIGGIIGSHIGKYLGGDNVFARVGASTVLDAFGSNLGEIVDRLGTGGDLTDAIDEAFSDFGSDLGAAFQSATIGAISAALIDAFIDSVNLDGVTGQAIESFATQALGSGLNGVWEAFEASITAGGEFASVDVLEAFDKGLENWPGRPMTPRTI